MIPVVKWEKKVAEDYRERIIVDSDNPILAFKASRDRYANLPNQRRYAGLPLLGSGQSEDALTWNVFRSLQIGEGLEVITSRLKIGQPQGLLLWTLAPETDGANAKLQYVAGAVIRKFDGIFSGQVTEPDVIMLGTTGIAVIECKLSEPDKAPSHLWEGTPDSVSKRLPIYHNEISHLLSDNVSKEEIAPVYQLVRMAFYAMKLGASFKVEPVVVSLANRRNWSREIHKLRKSPSDLWKTFCTKILGKDSPRCEAMFWQDLPELVEDRSLDALSEHLSTHHCL
jgi:hypothetical protein